MKREIIKVCSENEVTSGYYKFKNKSNIEQIKMRTIKIIYSQNIKQRPNFKWGDK